MSEAIKIDETTGLPELPEGHFWSVCDDYTTICVEIRKRRKRFGSKRVIKGHVYRIIDGDDGKIFGHAIFALDDRDLTPEAIQASAKRLLADWRKRDESILRYEENKKLLGAYPPKKLEVK